MSLSNELISQFAKIAIEKPQTPQESTMFGTIVSDFENGALWLELDGSDRYTPVSTDLSTVSYKAGDRVMVLIKNHAVTIIGNITSKAASGSQVTELEYAVADSVTTEQLAAVSASIDQLHADNATINGELDVAEAYISELQADNVEIRQSLVAHEADISYLETEKLDAKVAEAEYAKAADLEATDANIYNLEATHAEFQEAAAKKFEATDASILDLNTKKLSATEAALKYATIDFSNIGEAAIKRIFSETGMIKDLVVGDQTLTGELVGVTISGDLIKGNTVKADKLVVKGSDGLYYKLNIEAGAVASTEVTKEQLQNGLHGTVIIAKTITAEKISVSDLVAFGATIGGFHISTNSLYSGSKASVDNTTRGIYLDSDGQAAVGDSSNFIKYYKDTDGTYKLAISAESIIIATTNKNVETALNDVAETLAVSGRNLIVRQNELKDTYVVAQGTVLDCESNYKSATMRNPIRVEPGQSYVFSKSESAASLYFRWAWFDENMNVLGRSADSAKTFSWVAPENAHYAIISYPYIDGGNPKLEKGTEATAYTPAIEDLADTIAAVEAGLNKSIDDASDELRGELNDLDIGGRNLIINSDFRYGIDKWVPLGVTVSIEDDSTFGTCLKMVSNDVGSSEQRIYPSTTENFVHTPGTYALSFYAKADAATSVQTNIAGSADTGVNHTLTTEWKRFTRVYEAGNGSLTFWPNESNATIYLTRVKVETGDKPTDWTPAVEDMADSSEVEKAQTSAEAAQETADEARALIAQLSDSISMLVTDGNGTSLMTQTDDGWTFSTAEIQSAINTTSDGLDSLVNELGDTNSAVDVLKQAVADLGTIAEYVKIGTYEGEPCIELGEGDSDFKLLITNTRIMFKEGTNVPAYFNNQSMHIKKAVVEEELQQGGFVWKVRSNGNLGLVWKGVTS